ncbi:MAG: hypothetical protein R3Y65_00600 [Bacillota bacterium]
MKLKNRATFRDLMKYLIRIDNAIAYAKLYVLSDYVLGKRYRDEVENLDVLEQKKKYIQKRLRKTPIFAMCYGMKEEAVKVKFLKDMEFGKEKEAELEEEIFYLVHHIKKYEEKVKNEGK